MTTTAESWKHIKEIEKLAKKLGWSLSFEDESFHKARFVLTPKSGWANMFDAANTHVKFETTEEMFAFLKGWEAFKDLIDHVEFDIEEFKERAALLAPIKAIKNLK